jgi:hypothetical protein
MDLHNRREGRAVTHADIIAYLIGVSQNVVAALLGVAVHHHYRVKPLLRYVGVILQKLGEENPTIELPTPPKEIRNRW